MCGIVGTIGTDKTLDTAVEALQCLEYRGYDSFGVSVLDSESIATKKTIGSVTEHAKQGFFNDVESGMSAIAHTRWATHGGVTEENAHPHQSYDGAFSLVHNGVIENYQTLRATLKKQGVRFTSETDTEVVVHHLAKQYEKLRNVEKAFYATLAALEGEYALVFMTTHDSKHLYAAKYKSPLGFGFAKGMGIIASDQRALGPLTSDITFLEDGDVLVISKSDAVVTAQNGRRGYRQVRRRSTSVPCASDDARLGGYAHHMIKEVHETSIAAERVFDMKEEMLQRIAKDAAKKNIYLIGAGSAFYVAQLGQYYFSMLAQVSVHTHPSDEALSLVSFSQKDHLIALSQSGETFDTLEAMRIAVAHKTVVTAINNVYGSSAQRLATYPVFQGSGTEVCVLSTKSIISQSLILYRLAKYVGLQNGTLSKKEFTRLTKDEKRFVPAVQELFKKMEGKIKATAGWNRHVDNWFFIGRGLHYPVAMESALKWKEVSYIHAEGMPAGFFKHGTISLIDDRFYTVAFLPSKRTEESLFKFTASNISEIHARGGHVIAIGHDKDVSDDIGGLYDYIALPSVNKYLDPLLELITGQLLAYYGALALGKNIDKPRALAKAVTVR
jgi:glucosamine--fructose-6-phosphate aminotransferase (isomerizing)